MAYCDLSWQSPVYSNNVGRASYDVNRFKMWMWAESKVIPKSSLSSATRSRHGLASLLPQTACPCFWVRVPSRRETNRFREILSSLLWSFAGRGLASHLVSKQYRDTARNVRNANAKTDHQTKHVVCWLVHNSAWVVSSAGSRRLVVSMQRWNVNEERAHCVGAKYLVYRVVPRRGFIVRPTILNLRSNTYHTQAQSLSVSNAAGWTARKANSASLWITRKEAEGEKE